MLLWPFHECLWTPRNPEHILIYIYIIYLHYIKLIFLPICWENNNSILYINIFLACNIFFYNMLLFRLSYKVSFILKVICVGSRTVAKRISPPPLCRCEDGLFRSAAAWLRARRYTQYLVIVDDFYLRVVRPRLRSVLLLHF